MNLRGNSPEDLAKNLSNNNLLISIKRDGKVYLFCGINTNQENNLYINYFKWGDHLSLHAAFKPYVKHLRGDDNDETHYETLVEHWDDSLVGETLGERGISLAWFQDQHHTPLSPKMIDCLNKSVRRHEIIDCEELIKGDPLDKGICIKGVLVLENKAPHDDNLVRFMNEFMLREHIGLILKHKFSDKCLLLSLYVRNIGEYGHTFEVTHELEMQTTGLGPSELIIRCLPKPGQSVIVKSDNWGKKDNSSKHPPIAGIKRMSLILQFKGNVPDSSQSVLYNSKFNEGFTFFKEAEKKSGQEAIDLYEEAIKKFEETLQLKPKYPPAYNQTGIALYKLAGLKNNETSEYLLDLAEQKFQSALAIDGDYYKAYNGWGKAIHIRIVLRHEKNCAELYKSANEKYDASIAINPNNDKAYYNRGDLFLDGSKHYISSKETMIKLLNLAKADFEKTISINPGHENARRKLTEVAARLKELICNKSGTFPRVPG